MPAMSEGAWLEAADAYRSVVSRGLGSIERRELQSLEIPLALPVGDGCLRGLGFEPRGVAKEVNDVTAERVPGQLAHPGRASL